MKVQKKISLEQLESAKLEASEELVKWMTSEGVNQAEFARRSGISKPFISEWLANSENVTVCTLARAAHAFGRRIQIRFVCFLLCAAPAVSEPPPLIATAPKTLPEAIAEGVPDIRVISSGTLTSPLVLKAQKLTCEPGVVIAFDLSGIRNAIEVLGAVEIVGCTFRVRGQQPGAVSAEGPHAISLRGVEGFAMENCHVSGAVGDGLYIGPGRDSSRKPCSKVSVKACVFDGNGRQGVSVVSGRDVLLDACVFSGTTGGNPPGTTTPGAGLDIEPANERDHIVNVTVRDCVSANNWGYGYAIQLARLSENSEPVSLVGERNIYRGNDRHHPLMVSGFQSTNSDGTTQTVPPGQVTFEVKSEYGRK